jgi:cephalosporin hydroxylase
MNQRVRRPRRPKAILLGLVGVLLFTGLLRAAEPKPRVIVEQFTQLFFFSQVWEKTTWLGVNSFQTPTDNWAMQEILAELKPDFVIETGTRNGGTALYYASILSLLGTAGRVITVDVEPRVDKAAEHNIFRERVQVITGSSTAPEVIERIATQVKGRRVLVTLDSLHTKAHVLKELELYAPLVSEGSYLVVQDTAGDKILPERGPGPTAAVDEFLKTHPEFTIDRTREKFLLTFYPRGYLRKAGSPAPVRAPS